MQNSRGRLQFSNLIGELNVRFWPKAAPYIKAILFVFNTI